MDNVKNRIKDNRENRQNDREAAEKNADGIKESILRASQNAPNPESTAAEQGYLKALILDQPELKGRFGTGENLDRIINIVSQNYDIHFDENGDILYGVNLVDKKVFTKDGTRNGNNGEFSLEQTILDELNGDKFKPDAIDAHEKMVTDHAEYIRTLLNNNEAKNNPRFLSRLGDQKRFAEFKQSADYKALVEMGDGINAQLLELGIVEAPVETPAEAPTEIALKTGGAEYENPTFPNTSESTENGKVVAGKIRALAGKLPRESQDKFLHALDAGDTQSIIKILMEIPIEDRKEFLTLVADFVHPSIQEGYISLLNGEINTITFIEEHISKMPEEERSDYIKYLKEYNKFLPEKERKKHLDALNKLDSQAEAEKEKNIEEKTKAINSMNVEIGTENKPFSEFFGPELAEIIAQSPRIEIDDGGMLLNIDLSEEGIGTEIIDPIELTDYIPNDQKEAYQAVLEGKGDLEAFNEEIREKKVALDEAKKAQKEINEGNTEKDESKANTWGEKIKQMIKLYGFFKQAMDDGDYQTLFDAYNAYDKNNGDIEGSIKASKDKYADVVNNQLTSTEELAQLLKNPYESPTAKKYLKDGNDALPFRAQLRGVVQERISTLLDSGFNLNSIEIDSTNSTPYMMLSNGPHNYQVNIYEKNISVMEVKTNSEGGYNYSEPTTIDTQGGISGEGSTLESALKSISGLNFESSVNTTTASDNPDQTQADKDTKKKSDKKVDEDKKQ